MSRIIFLLQITLTVFYFANGKNSVSCPCTNPKLCEPVSTHFDHEVFVFTQNKDDWPKYDWTKITTISEVLFHSPDLLCYAHSKGVRVTYLAGFGPTTALPNKTARAEWITTQVKYIRDNHLDGINVDYESPIHADQTDFRNGLTMLMQELNRAMKKEFKHFQITYDVPFRPTAYDRWYDYKGIAKECDFVFDMAYDIIWNTSNNRAHSNSDLIGIQYGIEQYVKQGIPANKIVLGLPWYGYNYQCVSYTQQNHTCLAKSTSQVNYTVIVEKIQPQSTTGLLWDDVSKSPYFTYKDSTTNQLHQVWFDNPKSLSIKYNYAKSAGLRGVGMWTADGLDYSDTIKAHDQRKEMWGLLPWSN